MVDNLMISIDRISPAEWDAFIEGSPSGHLLQSWPWGDLKAQFGWQPVRLAVLQDGDIAAAAQILLRRTPLGIMAYVPKGPVWDHASDNVKQELLAGMHQVARQHRAIVTKVEPDWVNGSTATSWLVEAGFRPSLQTVQPRRTIILDITPDEEDILDAMKSKTRYNIRLAERKGVIIREGDEGDIPAFHRLMTVTGDRDEFGVHSQDYFGQVWRLFAPAGRAKLLLATYQGKMLAGLMAFAFGSKAWYMYGASSNEHRNLMPTYLLQWEAIRWAKSKGCRTYDLFGIPDRDEEELEAAVRDETLLGDSPPTLWGVYRHKRGYGGDHVRYVGAYDHVHRALAHGLLSKALDMWRKLRG